MIVINYEDTTTRQKMRISVENFSEKNRLVKINYDASCLNANAERKSLDRVLFELEKFLPDVRMGFGRISDRHEMSVILRGSGWDWFESEAPGFWDIIAEYYTHN